MQFLWVIVAIVVVCLGHMARAQESRFIQAARHLPKIETALRQERPDFDPPAGVTGITVPHHLLAADLIARGVWAASARQPKRILLLSPDHPRDLETPFGVTTAPLDAETGPVPPDPAISDALLVHRDLFTDTGNVPIEHGVHSVTPFLASVFPGVPVAAVTSGKTAGPTDWARLADILEPLIAPDTLIVQSTDYSHHLPQSVAVLRDQETLSILSTGDASAALALNQPAHLDSLASQWLMTELQTRVHAASPVIIANRSSARYVPGAPEQGTTSYVVAAWSADAGAGSALRYDDQDVLWFGGDVMTGRGMIPVLSDPQRLAAMVQAVQAITGGAPLLVNLEGALLPERPIGAHSAQHWLPPAVTRPALRGMGVTAVSLANNHAGDFGPIGTEMTAEALLAMDIMPMFHAEVVDLGPVRILPLTFRRSYFAEHDVIRTGDQLAQACDVEARPPVVAFVHWGGDYTATPDREVEEATRILRDCGITAVIGAHGHVASDAPDAPMAGGILRVTSLGNLIFDQMADVSGALAELRVFEQGTVALRLVPVPNFFDAQRLD